MEVFNGIIITEGGNLMNKNILIGIFSPLFYFLVNNIMRYTILAVEYNDKYALFHNMLIITLPALPGISLVFLLIRSSLKEYFKSLNICFWVSFAVIIIYIHSRIDLIIYTAITGYEELSLGDGLLTAITLMSYIGFCLGGAIVAGIATYVKQRKLSQSDIPLQDEIKKFHNVIW